MGLVADQAIITVADVEAISGQSDLAQLDKGSATLANALIQATNHLILYLRGDRGIDPSKIANTDDLKIPAALFAAHLRLVSQPDEESQARGALLKARFDEALSKFVFISSDPTSTEQTDAVKGLPRTVNSDAAPFFGPTNNTRHGRINLGGFMTR